MEEQPERIENVPIASSMPSEADAPDVNKEDVAETQENKELNVNTAPVQESTSNDVSLPNSEAVMPLPLAPPLDGILAHIEQEVCQANTAMAQLRTEFQELQLLFDAKIRFDQSREKMVDALHKELQGYREDFAFRLIHPMINALINLHDDLGRLLDYQQPDEDPAKEAARLRQSISVLQDVIEGALEQEDVQPFQEESSLFNGQRQRPTSIEPTNNPELDKHIYRRLKKGFLYKQKILRPESVTVYKFVPVSTSEPDTTENPQEINV